VIAAYLPHSLTVAAILAALAFTPAAALARRLTQSDR
jgi:hypothetical protein